MTRRWPEFRKYLFPLLANPQNSGRNRRNRSLFATATKSRRYQESSCRYIIQIASSEHILYLAITILSAFTSSHEIPSSFLRLVRAITSSFLSFVVHAFVCLCACVYIVCLHGQISYSVDASSVWCCRSVRLHFWCDCACAFFSAFTGAGSSTNSEPSYPRYSSILESAASISVRVCNC